jgi:Na+/H+ antiporter NhaD/arsenite permease-like protein
VTPLQIVELAIAALLIATAIVLIRRPVAEGARRGSQGGVILLLVGILVAIHGLGFTQYRPTATERDAAASPQRIPS